LSTKITLIGAGSASFGLNTISDIARSQELHGSAVALTDVSGERLTLMEKVANRLNEHYNARLRIETSTKADDVLDGSEFVMIAADIEMMKRWKMNFQIPFKHGIKQIIGSCGGPGGLGHTLIVIPLMLKICRDIEDYCKDALVLDLTNPEARVINAISKYTKIKAYGLCPGIYDRLESFSELFAQPVENFEPFAAGLNHFTWLLDIRFKDGSNVYPALDEKLKQQPDFEPVCRELYNIFHYYPSPGDALAGEYVPFAWDKAHDSTRGMNHIKKIEDRGTKVSNDALAIARGELSPELLQQRQWIQTKSPVLNRSVGAGVRIIKAIVGNMRRYEYSVNLPNAGYVSNLSDDIVVEVPASVDRSGIHGVGVGSLPKGIGALCSTQGTIQNLAVEAAVEGSYDKALQALLIDPVVPNPDTARVVLNDLLEAHAELLPQFKA